MKAGTAFLAFVIAGATGLGVYLAGSGRALRRADQSVEPHLILRTHAGPVRTVPAGERVTWRGQFAPASESKRARFFIDGDPVTPTWDDAASTETSPRAFELALEGLNLGAHEIEARVERRGGRRDSIRATVVAGNFEERGVVAERCTASISASAAAVRAATLPIARDKLLTAVRGQPFLGDAVRVSVFDLTLIEGGAQVRVRLEGDNTLEVRAQIGVARAGERRVALTLRRLQAVEFYGSARNWARGGGLGVGALLGGPAGAVAGLLLVDAVIDDQSKRVVREQIQRALRRTSEFDLLAPSVTLIEGEPRSRVALRFCEDIVVDASSLDVRFAVAPISLGPVASTPSDRGPRGPLVSGKALTRRPLEAGHDLRAELHVDALHALLDSWAASGLLAERSLPASRLAAVNDQLAPWTPLRVDAVAFSLPPLLRPGPSTSRFRVDWPGLQLALSRTDEVPVAPGERVELSLRGWVGLVWSAPERSLRWRGGVDDVWLACVVSEASHETRRACFGTLADAAELPRRIDTALQEALRGLPPLRLATLLEGLGLELQALELVGTPGDQPAISLNATLAAAAPGR